MNQFLTRPVVNTAMDKIDINEWDNTIHVIASGYCDVISNWLWRHQQNGNRAGETRWRCVKIVVLWSFMDSLCRVRNVILVFIFPRCFTTREINTTITLSWALKQFVTQVHTLFSICLKMTTKTGLLGYHSLSGWTSYRKISWDSGVDFSNRSEIWQAPRQQRRRDACQIAEWYGNYNIQSCGFEASRDLVPRRLGD